MAIINTLDAYDMKREFERFDRDYFSLEACDALIELSEEFGDNIEFDVIGFCCDFTEESPEYIRNNYDNIDKIREASDDELLFALNYYTWAVLLDNGNILYQNF